jgi:hypothetical protein
MGSTVASAPRTALIKKINAVRIQLRSIAESPDAIIGDPARAMTEWGQPSQRSYDLNHRPTICIAHFVAGAACDLEMLYNSRGMEAGAHRLVISTGDAFFVPAGSAVGL